MNRSDYIQGKRDFKDCRDCGKRMADFRFSGGKLKKLICINEGCKEHMETFEESVDTFFGADDEQV